METKKSPLRPAGLRKLAGDNGLFEIPDSDECGSSDTRFVLSAKSGIAHCLACFQEKHRKPLVPYELRRYFRDPSGLAKMGIGSEANSRSPRRRRNLAKHLPRAVEAAPNGSDARAVVFRGPRLIAGTVCRGSGGP